MDRLANSTLPQQPLVPKEDILDWNFEWQEDMSIPFETFDHLRLVHGIDVTGLNMSLTQGGNLYRSHALLKGFVKT